MSDLLVQPSSDSSPSIATPPSSQGIGRIAARGGVLAISSQGSMFLIQTFTTLILARLLTPYQFGLFAMAAPVTGFMLLFKDLGFSSALIQRKDITHEEANVVFWINLGIGTCISLLILSLATPLSWFYHEPKLIGVIAALSLGFFLSGFSVPHQALLNRKMRFRAIAFSDNFSILASSFIGLICAWRGLGVWSLVVMQVAFFAFNSMTLWFLSGWRPSRPAWHSSALHILSWGGHLTGGSIMNYIARNIDNFWIGRIWGANALGYYGRAYQLLMIPVLQLSAPIRSVTAPILSRLNEKPEQYRQICRTLVDNLSRFSMPAITFMIVTSDWMVAILLGPRWHDSARIFSYLGIAAILQTISSSLLWIMAPQGRSRDIFNTQCIASLMIIAAVAIGLPWGASGVAISISIGELCVRTPYIFYMIGRRGPVKTLDMYKSASCGIISAIGVLLTVELIRFKFIISSPIQGFLITLPCAILAALFCIYCLPGKRRAFEDTIWLFSMIHSKISKESHS